MNKLFIGSVAMRKYFDRYLSSGKAIKDDNFLKIVWISRL